MSDHKLPLPWYDLKARGHLGVNTASAVNRVVKGSSQGFANVSTLPIHLATKHVKVLSDSVDHVTFIVAQVTQSKKFQQKQQTIAFSALLNKDGKISL